MHSARNTSSLARTRELILMTANVPTRALYNPNDQIPGPSQE